MLTNHTHQGKMILPTDDALAIEPSCDNCIKGVLVADEGSEQTPEDWPHYWPPSFRFNESTLVQDVVSGKIDPSTLDLWVVLVDLNKYRPFDMHQTLEDVPPCAMFSAVQKITGLSYEHRVLRSSERVTFHDTTPHDNIPMGILIFERGKSRAESRLLLFVSTSPDSASTVPLPSRCGFSPFIDWDGGELGIAKF